MTEQRNKAGEQDAEVKENPQTKKAPKGAFFMLMDSRDRIFWRVSVLSAIIGGVRFPLMALYMGDSFNSLGTPQPGKSMSEVMEPTVIRMMIISVVSGIFKGLSDVSMAVVQHSMVAKYQQRFFDVLLRKDSAWYDENGPSVLLSAMTTAVFQISDLFGPELASCIMGVSAFVLSTAIALSRSWQLGLIFVGVLPLMIIFMMIGFRGFMKYQKTSSGILGGGTLCLEQGLWGIRTVSAYGLELTIGQNLEPWVRMSAKASVPHAWQGAAGFACRMCIEMSGAALMYYVGSRFVIAEDKNVMTGRTWTPGDIFSVWFIQYLGMAQLQMSLGYGQTFSEGKGAFATLAKYSEGGDAIEGADQDRVDDGPTFDDIVSIEFDKVSFRYPSRPDTLVLDQVSFTVTKGSRVALVGESGSGKSTIIGLIERFYEPEAGHIRVNGRDIREYPLASLRRAVALVEQEPILFASSLRRNLEYARSGAGQATLTDTEINDISNKCAMDFVDKLPQKVDTYVGAKGGTFSGGQKQRCCIARALLRRPKVLLLDEATAALDNRSEKQIQATLDEVISTAGMSIAIAHRLSTIKQCNLILVFSKGKIVERGSHDELMQVGSEGMYHGLVKLQEVATEREQGGQHTQDDVVIDTKKTVVITDTTGVKSLDLSKITPRRFWHVMPALWCEIFRFSTANGILGIVVQLAQMCMSATHPIFALVLISMLTSLYGTDKEELDRASTEATILLVILGLVQGICVLIRMGGGLLSSENFMCMARLHIARNLIYQDVSFFDNPDCAPAKILILFSALVREGYFLIRMVSAQIVDATGTFILTLAIAFSREAKVAGVVLAVWPVNMITKYIEFRDLMRKFKRGNGGDSESASAQVFHDCINFLRTVRAMQAEQAMQRDFTELVQQEGFKNFKTMGLTGLVKGVAYSLEMMLYAFTFWWSARVIDDGGDFDRCLQAGLVIILGLMPISSFLSAFDRLHERVEAGARTLDFLHHAQSIHRPEETRGRLFPMSEKPPTTAPYDVLGKKLVFENVRFVYEQRPEVTVLKAVNLEVNLGQGQLVGLCGPSGGGKSSMLALLMRFYDPTSGNLRVDGLGNLRELDVKRWRRTISYVSQEPTLFQDTLLNNVRYGCTEAGPEELSRAATMAHIDFTGDSPEFDPAKRMEQPRFMLKGELKAIGYTEEAFEKLSEAVNRGSGIKNVNHLGWSKEKAISAENAVSSKSSPGADAVSWTETVRGTTLSGGQKQRVAIARAFLRNSPILIFDEGTSALDSFSEKKVQESLKSFREHQTQFLIAHRLSTIADANLIVVVSMGVIAESGSSQELLDKRGIYYNLVQGSK